MQIVTLIRNARERIAEVVSQDAATVDSVANIRALKCAKVALTPGVQNAFAFAWQNPEDNKILITRCITDITTSGGAAATMNVGVVANATSTAADIFSGVLLDSTTVQDNLLVGGKGAGGVTKVDEKDGANDYITGKILGNNANALVGNIYIFYTEI